jgi:hypothetical protein
LFNAKHEKKGKNTTIFVFGTIFHGRQQPSSAHTKLKLQITIGNLHNTYETLKLRREKKKEIVVGL